MSTAARSITTADARSGRSMSRRARDLVQEHQNKVSAAIDAGKEAYVNTTSDHSRRVRFRVRQGPVTLAGGRAL